MMQFSTYDPSNIKEIKQLFFETFSDSEGQSEGMLIGDLAYDLLSTTHTQMLYCFVASENKKIVGCIILTKLEFENAVNAFLLSPVAIQTNYQGRGIGQELINFGLNILKKDGVEFVFTYGDPEFYSKVGFSFIDQTIVQAPYKLTYPNGWLGQSLRKGKVEPIIGKSHCVKAFNKPELW